MADFKENFPCEDHDQIVSTQTKANRTVCIVPGCNQRYGRGASFHTFPKKKDKKRMNAWVAKLRLKLEPTSTSRVCSSHFSIENFISPTSKRCTDRMILKSTAVPDINLPRPAIDPKKDKAAMDRAERADRRRERSDTQEGIRMPICMVTEDKNLVNQAPVLMEAAVQVDTLNLDKLFVGRRRTMSVRFKHDRELNSWTGLASLRMLSTFVESLSSLATYKKRPHSTVSVEEEVLVVLIKMKTNLSFSCMSTLFNLQYQTISLVFYRTVPQLKMICTALIPWPSLENVRRNMPHYFRPNYTDVVAVLDCTEMAVKKPTCLHCRINAYLHYKGRETAKYLIAVTPGGTISYVSREYGGKASDKQIVAEEKMLEMVNIGEAVMTDKGFSIDAECKALGVKLVRPPFLTAPQYQLSTTDAFENVSIAAARVHVERAIQRIKIF
ncbi:uncharacterized protein LOC129730006 [Wyeomyia smithii]|uniref:uncharacterized protein LOC129730006 n=1 Tax=Wyeomyia smithii TaxID=174621 RepID=UPI00246811F8|nr:uncharacterized protein LOC129730006 [Wyeomyia smithii]